MSDAIKIVVIDENPVRVSVLLEGLYEAGYTRVTVINEMQRLLSQVVQADPDVIFIDLENPNRDVLEQMFHVSRTVRRPIAMFVDKSDTTSIEAAIDAGVSAYIVDGLRKERIKPILDTTISRFNAFKRLREELERTKQALNERKTIEKAKGILMRNRQISEEEAYGLLRKTAMNEGRRVADVAAGLAIAAGLLG
jgi:two-component system, response regulator / RNA-binding antiterminator